MFTLLPNIAHSTELSMTFFITIITKLLANEACDEVVSRAAECSDTG